MLTVEPIYVLGVAGAIAIVLMHGLCARLRRAHPATWEELGKPSLLHSSDRDFKTVRRFLKERRFVAMGDPVLTRWAWLAILYKWAVLVGIIGGLGWLFWPFNG